MRVYHYLEAKWALDDIARRRLKLSRIDDLNDPYELRCVHSVDPPSQAAVAKTTDAVKERYGIECFSRSWSNVLMWSHYGDKHRGICLGFDVPDELTRPVEYLSEVQIETTLMVEKHSDFSAERGTKIIDRLLGAKYEGWSYEQEIRVHAGLSEIDDETGLYFVDFSERLRLKEVIAGVRFPSSKKCIQDALDGYLEDIAITKAAICPTRFEIVVDENGFA